jgi:hypothetical protein
MALLLPVLGASWRQWRTVHISPRDGQKVTGFEPSPSGDHQDRDPCRIIRCGKLAIDDLGRVSQNDDQGCHRAAAPAAV